MEARATLDGFLARAAAQSLHVDECLCYRGFSGAELKSAAIRLRGRNRWI